MRAAATFLLFLLPASTSLHICGSFCGPTWCDDKVEPECADVEGSRCTKSAGDCTEGQSPDGSCADACCNAHDKCCGSSDRRPCNNAIVNCLKNCGGITGDDDLPSCYKGALPIPVIAIETAMELNPYDCCGTPCDYTGPVGLDGRMQTVERRGQAAVASTE